MATANQPTLEFVLRNYRNFNARATRDALHAYATALADTDTFRDAAGVGRLLSTLGLTAGEFINRYTSAPMQDH